MSNFLSRVAKKVKFWLFEERDDIYANNPKRRRQLHNAYAIQACLVLIGIGTMALIPLALWLALKGFVIVYLVSTVVAGILYLTISSYVKHLNKRYEIN
jgi:hypothetical protein